LPTDVQAEAIPLILGGGDVLMAAETGLFRFKWREIMIIFNIIINY